MLRKAGIKLNRNSVAYRRLVLGNAVVDSLRSQGEKKKKCHGKSKQIGAMLIKKYRCISQVSKEVGLSRRKVSQLVVPRISKSIKQKYSNLVKNFLEREDNSTVLPGKRDVIKKAKTVEQKRILNDYLHKLYNKFHLENPEIKLSRSTFCALRPSNMILTNFSSRRTCLCTYHQNFALKIKSMKNIGLICSNNPDVFIKEYENFELLEKKLNEVCKNNDVKYRMWKKIPDGDKFRWREIEEIIPKDDFIKLVIKEHGKFSAHVHRVHNQYTEMRKLREKLPNNDILIWMDFAENYSCSSVEEVQSAYWNAQMVSLHTMVVYFPNNHNKKIQSFVAISNCLNHNAAVVYTILKNLVPKVKEEFPQLQQIHYLTDSPSSQYRNKTIFQVVCEHEKEFGVKARWNYLECGHGKGPCDGLGASVKRGADIAVKQEKCLIQDAADFFEWTKRSKGESKVKFMYYTEDEILKATNDLKEKNPVSTINGTMKVHAVVPVSLDTIAVRDLSCYCHDCLTNGNKSNCGWNEKIFVKSSEKVRKPAPTNIISEETLNSSKQTKAAYQEKNPKRKTPIVEANMADWVAAVYEEQWYIGQVTDIDKENDEIQVNFLEKSGRYEDTYKFPIRKDEIMIPNSDILIVLKNFLAVGKTKRTYKLGDEVKRSIIDKFAFWLAKTST